MLIIKLNYSIFWATISRESTLSSELKLLFSTAGTSNTYYYYIVEKVNEYNFIIIRQIKLVPHFNFL